MREQADDYNYECPIHRVSISITQNENYLMFGVHLINSKSKDKDVSKFLAIDLIGQLYIVFKEVP